MARPVVYDWEAIRLAYEKGFSRKEIQDKFKLTSNTLGNKIRDNKWTVKGSVDNDIVEIKGKLEETSLSYSQNKKVSEMYEDRVSTMIEDNEIISSNRKLVKSFLSLADKGIREGIYKTPQDIKIGMSTLKDSEAIANPNRVNQNINLGTQNNIQNNTTLTLDEAKKICEKEGIPLNVLEDLTK